MSSGVEEYSTRALTADDWREFSVIRLESLQKYPHFFGSTHAHESTYSQEDWQKWLGYNDGRVFGLYCRESIIGITGIRSSKEDPACGFMIASYIKPEYQGNGLSLKLYEARIDWALNYPQWTKIEIGHRDGNESSRRANQKWGFQFIGKKSRTWPDGTVADEYIYELDLEELRREKLKQPKQHGI